MPEKHATLGPSKAKQWIGCPPSVRLEEGMPDRESSEASEGTLAHKLAEETLRYLSGEISNAAYTRRLNKIKEDPQYTPAMMEHVENYAVLIQEQASEARKTCPDALVLYEQELHFDEYVPGGFGTSDAVIIADGTAHVIDFKYGKGVLVDALDNPQLRLYALGALLEFGDLYDIQTVKMTIVQPRLDNVSTDSISAADLIKWAEETVKPAAKLAAEGKGPYGPDEDVCRWCKAKPICRAYHKKQLEIEKYSLAEPPTLDEDEIAEILGRVDSLVKWANMVKDYALDQALRGEAKYPGFKLVEGRSVRKYSDQGTIASSLLAAGCTGDQIYKPLELIGITDMEKLLGKKRFGELVGPYVVKPEGKPVLVPETDKRPELNTVTKVAAAFEKEEE